MFHIEEKHSWDLLFIEITTAVFWFNPVFYFIRKEIKIIQEFLADQYATKEESISEYAELLLLQALQTHQHKLINPFFHNQLKRRITMLTTSKKPAQQYLRKLMVLPLVAIAIMLFSFTYNKEIKEVKQTVENKIEAVINSPITPTSVIRNNNSIISDKELGIYVDAIDTIPKTNKAGSLRKRSVGNLEEVFVNSLDEVVVVGYSTTPDADSIFTKPNKPKYTKVEIEASYSGGAPAWKNFIERNIRGDVPVKNGAKPGVYRVFLQFMIDPEGNITKINPLSDVGYGMEEEAIRVLEKSEKWKPAIYNGRKVAAYRTQPFVFQVMPKSSSQAKGIVLKKEQGGIFTKVDKDASYPGGAIAWRNFLIKNLKGETPVDHGAKAGTYTTVIQFIVDKDGTVSDIKPLTKVGYGMEDEAMRIIKLSGKWKPAIQNGREVTAYRKQPLTFQVLEN
ncbi:MAG: energy transducer TonB [Niabella sp.]